MEGDSGGSGEKIVGGKRKGREDGAGALETCTWCNRNSTS